VVLGAWAWLALPATAQDAGGAAQGQPQNAAPAAPSSASPEAAGEGAAPQPQRRQQLPSGCPFRNNKLDLIA
jgi:hypothetical protein